MSDEPTGSVPPQQPLFSVEDVLKEWDDLTTAEAEEIAGRPDLLVAAIQDKFGVSHDEAARQVQDFMADRPESGPAK